MRYWITQSLLSSWTYFLNADDEYSQQAWDSFLSTLFREEKEATQAMNDGTAFEDIVNHLVAGQAPEGKFNAKWDAAARRFANLCAGGISQVPVAGELSAVSMDFALYGVCDYVKAGIIYDIKKVTQYKYGKYLHSPQHSMYFYLIPEAKRFDYLIFDGSNCHVEKYRPEDCKPIGQIIAEFICFLKKFDLLDTYQEFWEMNPDREEKWRAARWQ